MIFFLICTIFFLSHVLDPLVVFCCLNSPSGVFLCVSVMFLSLVTTVSRSARTNSLDTVFQFLWQQIPQIFSVRIIISRLGNALLLLVCIYSYRCHDVTCRVSEDNSVLWILFRVFTSEKLVCRVGTFSSRLMVKLLYSATFRASLFRSLVPRSHRFLHKCTVDVLFGELESRPSPGKSVRSSSRPPELQQNSCSAIPLEDFGVFATPSKWVVYVWPLLFCGLGCLSCVIESEPEFRFCGTVNNEGLPLQRPAHNQSVAGRVGFLSNDTHAHRCNCKMQTSNKIRLL